MHTSSKLILAGFTATLVMAFAVSSASAGHLSTSNQNFRVVWSSLEFNERFGFFGTIRCPVTLEGSFHSATIVKTQGLLIGAVTRASVISASCTGGRATVLTTTLPWHVTYEGFNGTLPNITGIRLLLIGASFLIEPGLSAKCLARTTTTEPAEGTIAREAGGVVTELTPREEKEISLTNLGGCPASAGRFSSPPGDGRITLLGNTTRITVTLI